LTLGPNTTTYSDLSQVFGYDVLNRLGTANLAAGQTQSFTYDANGNRTNATINAASTTYTYPSTSHKLTSLSGATTRSFTYDNAGNVTVSAGITYTYDGRGRMKQAASVTYLINGLGQRVKKNNGTDTFFAYDEAGRLIGEYDSTGAPIQETVWLGDLPVAVIKPASPSGFTVFYIWADHLGSPRLITDTNNASRWEWANNDPFGNNTPNENPNNLGSFTYNLRFPGQYYDAEKGSNYNYFRDYDPSLGRYVESDPIGLRGGRDTYSYVSSAPLTSRDPLGLDETIWSPGSGRGIGDGPRNGNWCGGNWSGGWVPSLHGGADGPKPPADSLDRCCMAHDKCFGKCDSIRDKSVFAKCRYDCNSAFVSCQGNLCEDATKWPEPPRKGTEGDSQTFRDDAMRYFRNEMSKWEMSNARR
jgi:RHS repeat-associated protein